MASRIWNCRDLYRNRKFEFENELMTSGDFGSLSLKNEARSKNIQFHMLINSTVFTNRLYPLAEF